jgi:hypothetical protein
MSWKVTNWKVEKEIKDNINMNLRMLGCEGGR